MRKTFSTIVVLSTLATGCTLGPNYQGPPSPPIADQAGFIRADPQASRPEAPVSNWWKALNDAILDDLVERALQANPTIDIARARLRQARAALGLERSNGLPKGGASALYARAHLPSSSLTQGTSDNTASSDSSSASQLTLYNVGLDASWEVDIFGGQRRSVEAAFAGDQASQARLADVQVSIGAEVANAYIDLRDRQRRLFLGERAVGMQERSKALARQRFERGTLSEVDLLRLDDQLDQTRADQFPLRAQLESSLDALATLTGVPPGALDGLLAEEKPIPMPPSSVAVGDPMQILRRRPDIRAAERQLAADTARIGRAKAERYPSLRLLGVIGVGGTRASDLTHLDDFTALGAPVLSWNFVDFGAGRRVDQAEAVRDESQAAYRKAVLDALQDAEGSLSRFRHARTSLATLARTKLSSDRALELTNQRYQAGTGTLIDVLDTTRQQIAAEQGVSQSQANLLHNFVAIQKALGLGWTADGS